MRHLSLSQANVKAKALAFKLTASEGSRNAVLIARLAGKILRKQQERVKKN